MQNREELLMRTRRARSRVSSGAIGLLGALTLVAGVAIASPASAAQTNIVFGANAQGSNGSFSASTPFTPGATTYSSSVSDSSNPSATFTLSVAAGSADCALVTPATSTSFTVSYATAGTCAITATETSIDKDSGVGGGDGNQTGASATLNLTVTQISQLITLTPSSASLVYASPLTYQVKAVQSGQGSLTYSTTSSSCTVDTTTGLISVTSAGTCVVGVATTGNTNYAAASTTFTLTVTTPPPPPPAPPTPSTPPAPPVVVPPVVVPPVVVPPVVVPPTPKPIVIPVSAPKPVHRPAPTRTVMIKPFSEGSIALTKALKDQVWKLALEVRAKKYKSVQLAGYTDNVFTPAFDLLLVQYRANAVMKQLSVDLKKLKVTGVKIVIVPGLTIALVDSNATAKSRAFNRRVVATLRAR